MTTTRFGYADSPIDPIMIVSNGEAITGIFMDAQKYGPAHDDTWIEQDDGLIRSARTQFGAYFHGELTDFDLPLAPDGTPFQLKVWQALRAIAYGETISYGELARRIGKPAASRAVGAANGHNPISIVVPCHRVIGANGSLTGYGGGLDRKRILLALEAETLARHGLAAGGQRTLAFA